MAQLDRPGRAACCISPTPTPSSAAFYKSPACNLNSEQIDEILDALIAYDENDELPAPTDEQLQELENCADSLSFTQKRKLTKISKNIFNDFAGLLDIMLTAMYGVSKALEDSITNKNSQFNGELAPFDANDLDYPYQYNKDIVVNNADEFINAVKNDVKQLRDQLPNSITNAVDNIIEDGKLSIVDKLRLSVSSRTKRMVELLIGDVGLIVGPSDLRKLKDEGWLDLNGNIYENPDE